MIREEKGPSATYIVLGFVFLWFFPLFNISLPFIQTQKPTSSLSFIIMFLPFPLFQLFFEIFFGFLSFLLFSFSQNL
jgi:hypothetical protein